MKKIAVIVEIPVPYRSPMFEMISRIEGVELKVFYCAESEFGRDWSLNFRQDYDFEILKGWSIPIKGKKLFSFKINPSVWGKLENGNFDAVVLGGYAHFTMLMAVYWCLFNKVPYVLMSESQHLTERGVLKKFLKNHFLKQIIKRSSACLPTGTLARDYLISYGAKEEKCFFFPNTPDIDAFQHKIRILKGEKENIKRDLNIKSDKIILFVGRLIPVKGVEFLIDAFAEFRNNSSSGSSTDLVIAGDGPLRSSLERRVMEKNVKGVHFKGFIQLEQLPDFYCISDLFVLPSLYEPWGVVVNEALACGLPVVTTTRVGSSPDLVRENVNGKVIAPADSHALSEAISDIIENKELHTKMSANSMEIIKDWKYDRGVRSFRDMIMALSGEMK